MLKSVGFTALWLVASCAAIAVAWAGVSTVGNEIVAPAPAPTSTQVPAPTVESADGQDAVEPSASVVTTSTLAPTNPDGDATTIAPPPTSLAPSEPSPPPTNTTPTPSSTAPNQASTTTVPVPTTTSPPVTTVPPPTTTQPAGTTETFVLIGGTTAVRFEPSGATVLWAEANPEFDVSIEPESPGWKVEFRSDDHRSRVDVWWSGGARWEIREEVDD